MKCGCVWGFVCVDVCVCAVSVCDVCVVWCACVCCVCMCGVVSEFACVMFCLL